MESGKIIVVANQKGGVPRVHRSAPAVRDPFVSPVPAAPALRHSDIA